MEIGSHRWMEKWQPEMSTLCRLLINFRFTILHHKSFLSFFLVFTVRNKQQTRLNFVNSGRIFSKSSSWECDKSRDGSGKGACNIVKNWQHEMMMMMMNVSLRGKTKRREKLITFKYISRVSYMVMRGEEVQ